MVTESDQNTSSREWQIHHLQMQRKKRKKAIADGV